MSATEPWATDTAAPPTVIALPLTSVIARLAPSKLSLASTEMATELSSLTVAESSAMSTTAETVKATLSMSEAVPSLVVTVNVAAPL